MDLTAAVDVAAARQVPLGHGESRSAVGGDGNQERDDEVLVKSVFTDRFKNIVQKTGRKCHAD